MSVFVVNRNGYRPVTIAALEKAILMTNDHTSPTLALILAGVSDNVDVLYLTEPSVVWPARLLRRGARPTVVVISDDPGTACGFGGPSAWRCAPKIGKWAEGCIVHGAGGKREHYIAAAQFAALSERVVFVETTSLHTEAWCEAIGCPLTLVIASTDGPHPIDEQVRH